MAELFGKKWTHQDLKNRVGHLSQVAGIQLLRAEDGPARGNRYLEFRLGSGFIYKVALDRGMDVGYCEYKGIPLGWIPATMMPGPWFFEQQTEFGWLRSAMGGFCNSCGMLHIGNPENDSVAQYNFPARQEERYGVHDRMAMLPAQLMDYGDTWEGDDCIFKAEGKIVQAQVYGENLVLRRSYQSVLGEKRYFMRDEITNEGHYPTPLMLLYHINIGFPFLDDGSQLIAALQQPPELLPGNEAGEPEDRYRLFSAPHLGSALQVFSLKPRVKKNGLVEAAMVNPRLGSGGLGVYIRYHPNQFPNLLETKLLDEGHYFVSLEPCTNNFGRAALRQRGELPYIQPDEKRFFDLEVGVLEGENEIQAFREDS